MIDIFTIINSGRKPPAEETSRSYESLNCTGFSIDKNIRFMYFDEDLPDIHYIGFETLSIQKHTLYLIPPSDLYFLPHHIKGFHCISFSLEGLTTREKQALFRIKYKGNRSFFVPLQVLDGIGEQEEHNLSRYIFKALPGACNEDVPSQYIQLAEQFYQLLAGRCITPCLTIEQIAGELHVSDRTLLRVCNKVFFQTPKYILGYHFLAKCIFMILYQRQTPLSNIAYSLGFNEVSAFSRHIKKITRHTPKEIRDIYAHLDL